MLSYYIRVIYIIFILYVKLNINCNIKGDRRKQLIYVVSMEIANKKETLTHAQHYVEYCEEELADSIRLSDRADRLRLLFNARSNVQVLKLIILKLEIAKLKLVHEIN